jgi:hypothetical protein
MKGTVILVYMTLLFISASLASVVAQPQMPPPVYYGFVYVGGNRAPDGLNVTAVISGTSIAWTTLTNNGLRGNYKIQSQADDPDTPQKDGAVGGDRIDFYVNGTKTNQTATWSYITETIKLDLSIPGIPGSNSNISLTVFPDCPSAYAGYKVNISGRLAYTNGTGISGANLSLTYIVTNGISWNNISSVNTTIDGGYYVEWTPPAMVAYLIRVRWEGNEGLNLGGTEAYVSVATVPLEDKYVFSVVSNSTIFELTFNSSSRILSFTIDGPSGTTGYANVTVSKELIAETAGLKVYLDGNQTDCTATSTDTDLLLHFVYQHSVHNVTVNLGSAPQTSIEIPLGMAALIAFIAIIIMVAAFIAYRKLKQPRNRTNREKQLTKKQQS